MENFEQIYRSLKNKEFSEFESNITNNIKIRLAQELETKRKSYISNIINEK